MTRPRLLDLFCGAGGCSVGYHRAGFDIVGVDLVRQPRYPFEFHQADALTFLLDGFDAIHASPPCQRYIRSGMVNHAAHPDLLGSTRDRLQASGRPWIIENVPGAPMRPDIILCGSMFGLSIRRHRWFETNAPLSPLTLACDHSRPITGVYGHPHGKGGAWRNGARPMLPSDRITWSREMGIDWMLPPELALAIPPEYTRWIGTQLIDHLLKTADMENPGPHQKATRGCDLADVSNAMASNEAAASTCILH